ncbi:Ig-like domain-containing protein [Vibrio campbellii]|uniref:Ig-like domain-containing protein n=3 Tax=Vibrio harveyi group TaxID=717610 RepID=UPI001560BE4E|nr:Ig-like domain-containing protein [Vibrio campbellii]HBC3521123.1 Ig-like domain-containing protein [Vibrio parahaemolyticus]
MKTLWFYTITLLSLLLVGCNNGDDGLLDIPSGWSHKAASLAVTPKSASIPMGLTQQLEADAVLNTGQTVRVTTDSHLTWTSSDAAIATVDAAGLVTGVTQGTVTITAEGINNDGSRVSDIATITVTDAIATALTVTPKTKKLAKGLTQDYKAEALMSTGQVIDVTENAQLTWSSLNTTIATISNTTGSQGVAQSLEKGTTTIKAEGTVNGVTLSDTATLTVGDAVVTNIVVTPVNTSVPVGLEKAFTADAVMTDGTTQNVTEEATWTTADPGTALVSDTAGTKGIAEGRAVSATPVEITAAITIDGTDFSASGHLTVTDAVITGFAIEPNTASVPKGLVQNFLAKATLSDGDIVDVTEHANVSWTSSDTAIASISNSTGTKGQATGEAVGVATIAATATVAGNTWQDTATLSVTNAIVSSIQVTPANDTTPVGLTKPFTATATFSDNSTRDITADSTLSWSTDNTSIATISNTVGNKGVAKGEAIGSVTITATDTSGPSAVQGTATLDVTEAVITALQVSPPTATVPNGLTQQYTATAILSDNSTQDVTTDPAISWTTNNTAVASISNNAADKGTAKGESVGGPVTITATGSVGGQTLQATATITVTNAVVSRLQVTPTTETTPVGLSKSFIARAFFSDNTSLDVTDNAAVNWSSSDTNIATITTGQASGNGVAKGEAPGVVTIKASGSSNGSDFEGQATLTVTAAEVASMVVTPASDTTPIGLSKPFTATVTLTDGTPINVTDDPAISWSSSDPTIATIETGNTSGGNGVATGVNLGTVTITAQGTANGTTFTETAQLTVTNAVITALQVTPPTESTPIGLSKPFTATAILSDGSGTLDVTNEAAISWSSSDPSIATIVTGQASGNGVATGAKTGTVTITASGTTPEGTPVQGTATLEVTNAIITSLEVAPVSETVAKGLEQQFTATAYLSDGIHSIDVTNDPAISWTTDNKAVSVSASGLAKGEAVGSANVIATGTTLEGSPLSDSGVLNVTAAVVKALQVTPPNDTTPIGLDKQFTATAILTDNSTQPVTDNALISWSSNDPTIATITTGLASGNGLATGIATGSVTIKAQGTVGSDTFEGTATLDVTSAVPVANSLEITPVDPSIAKGTDQQFAAQYTLTDGTPVDVTNDSATNWTSGDTNIATITSSSLAGDNGLAHGTETGTVSITASGTYSGVDLEATTSLTVTAAEIASIKVTPNPAEIAKGRTQQFTATATMTDGAPQDITTDSGTSWVSTNTTTANISTSGADMGKASGDEVGITSIKATNSGMTGEAELTVTNAVLEDIIVTPDPLNIGVGPTNSGNLIATGVYSDGTTPDITNQVDWVSSDLDIATVNSGGTNSGLVTGIVAGSTTVTASMSNTEGVDISSNVVTVNVARALVNITIDPENVTLDPKETVSLTAWGTYNDSATPENITNLVDWNIVDPTVAVISDGKISSDGIGGVISNGTVSDGTTEAKASLDGVVSSNSVHITACNTLAGPCIDILDTTEGNGSGKLYTNSPSVKFLDSIGGGNHVDSVPEAGDFGPVGEFYRFDWNQANELCQKYNVLALAGRTNWRLADKDELQLELYGVYGNMFTALGWPIRSDQWSATEDGPLRYRVSFGSGDAASYGVTSPQMVPCVSNP